MFHLKLISMSMIQEYKNFNNQGGVKAPHNNKENTMQKVNKIKYDEIRGQEKNIIQISSSKNHSYNFLETEIKYFTQENGTKVYQFFLDGEIVKETTINPIRDRIDMRSKIHPRDFIQKDMLFEFNIGSTSAINEHNKRERK